jgi:hypothetical protein
MRELDHEVHTPSLDAAYVHNNKDSLLVWRQILELLDIALGAAHIDAHQRRPFQLHKVNLRRPLMLTCLTLLTSAHMPHATCIERAVVLVGTTDHPQLSPRCAAKVQAHG